MNDIVSVVSAVGFPILAAICCGYFVKWQYEQNLKQIEEMRKEHREEVAKMTEAINNNNTLLQRILDRFDGEG